MTAEVAKKYILTNHFDGMVDVKAIVGGNEETMAMKLAVEALEKQMPKKGIMIGDDYSSVLSCPNCRKPIVNVWNIAKYEPNYCHYCGQALDWSDEKLKMTVVSTVAIDNLVKEMTEER